MPKGVITLHPYSRIEQFAAGTEVIVESVPIVNVFAVATFTTGERQFIRLGQRDK